MKKSSERDAEIDTHHDIYSLKDESYFSGARADYVNEMTNDVTTKVLEIGCGNGATGALARAQGKCLEYVGVEVFEPMAERAAKVLDKVHFGNIETISLPYPAEYFDTLVMSEVLEHLLKPNAVIAKVCKLLKPGGMVFASSPNIAHWRVIAELVKGRFEYENQGIMDESHVHWFTPASFEAMFNQNGISTRSLGTIGKAGSAYRLAPRKLQHLFVTQINFIGFKK